MSDQQPNFDTATFSPSPFDTFQVPISDIVTQSVEDALAGNPVPTPESPASDEPTMAEAVATPETEAAEATEAVHTEAVSEQTPTAEVDIPAAAAAEDEPAQSSTDEAQVSTPVSKEVEKLAVTESQSTEVKMETPVEVEVAEQEIVTPELQHSSIDQPAAAAVIEEEEFISTEIDDVLIPPPPVAVQPVKTDKETPSKDLEPAQSTEMSPAPKPKIRTIKVTPMAQKAPEVQPVLETQPAEEFVPVPVVAPVTEPVTETPAEPVAQAAPAPAVQPVVEAKQPVTPKAEVVANAAPEVAVEEVPVSGFRALELREEVQQAIETSGYTTPTEIQSEIIPHVLAGRDVLAQSQTGTGKTAAFALPILSKINVAANKPQVLVLAPTRELAMQVADSFTTYGKHIPRLDVAAVYGGQSYDTQLRKLRRGVPIVVGC